MNKKATNQSRSNEHPASLSPEMLNSLADLVVAKLRAGNDNTLPSKQSVAGPNPVSRSK